MSLKKRFSEGNIYGGNWLVQGGWKPPKNPKGLKKQQHYLPKNTINCYLWCCE